MTIGEEEVKNLKTGRNISSKKEEEAILEVKDLKTYYPIFGGIFKRKIGEVKAVDGVSFKLQKRKTLGLVGESGCGKTTIGNTILNLVPNTEGEIYFGNHRVDPGRIKGLWERFAKRARSIYLAGATHIYKPRSTQFNNFFAKTPPFIRKLYKKMIRKGYEIFEDFTMNRFFRKKVQMVFQDPDASLNPRWRIVNIVELKKEASHIPNIKDVGLDKASRIIKEVGIADAEDILKRYPHELSGGMRQRVMIAMALSCNPALLIADEPTTALDVTIQAQILDLMKDLKTRFRTSILLITHDLGIIAELCDRIAVMYSGNIVEYATAVDLFKNPRHPYTKGLIDAIPSIEKRDTELKTIRGMVPNLIYPPSGCRFHPRCDYRLEICDKIKPVLTEIGDKYFVACHLFDPKYKDTPKYVWSQKEEDAFKI